MKIRSIIYHSYQDCPIDFHIWHSVPFHDHEIVPPTISWPVRYASVLSHTHESYVCRAKCRVCGTVKLELGQWIIINIGRARLKRNLDLISVFHCHCPRTQLRIKASVVRKAKNRLPSKLWSTKIIPKFACKFAIKVHFLCFRWVI